MIFTRTSILTGITRHRDLDVTPAQLAKWQAGTVIQMAMPHLSKEDREWLLSGMSAEEWAAEFPPEKDTTDVADR